MCEADGIMGEWQRGGASYCWCRNGCKNRKRGKGGGRGTNQLGKSKLLLQPQHLLHHFAACVVQPAPLFAVLLRRLKVSCHDACG